MKTKYTFLLVVLISSVFFSCSSSGGGGDEPEIPAEPVEAVFSSDIAAWEYAESPGVHTWKEGDEIGLFMVKTGPAGIAENVNNTKYHIESGKLTAGADTVFFPEDEDERVDFKAYHPYQALSSGLKFRVNTENQEQVTDLLYSDNSTNRSSANANTFLRFKHTLCKVYFAVKIQENMEEEDLSNMTVKFAGIKLQGDFSLMNGEWENISGSGDILAKVMEEKVHYELLLIPHIVDYNAEVLVEFGPADDRTVMSSVLPIGAKFVTGEEKKFSLLISRDELVVSEEEIGDWKE